MLKRPNTKCQDSETSNCPRPSSFAPYVHEVPQLRGSAIAIVSFKSRGVVVGKIVN